MEIVLLMIDEVPQDRGLEVKPQMQEAIEVENGGGSGLGGRQ